MFGIGSLFFSSVSTTANIILSVASSCKISYHVDLRVIPSADSWCILIVDERILRLILSTTSTLHSVLPDFWLCRSTSLKIPSTWKHVFSSFEKFAFILTVRHQCFERHLCSYCFVIIVYLIVWSHINWNESEYHSDQQLNLDCTWHWVSQQPCTEHWTLPVLPVSCTPWAHCTAHCTSNVITSVMTHHVHVVAP